jgi:chromosome segregation ATPase
MSQSSLPAQRPQEDALAIFLDRLHQVLDTDCAGREHDWVEAVEDALARLEAALQQHQAAAWHPEGPLAEIDQTRPTLVRKADELRNDYEDLARQLPALREQVRRAAEAIRLDGGDIAALRQQVEQLLAGLQEKREAEMKLVLDSVNTDIGAGD